MDRSYVDENRKELDRLRALVARLGDGDLSRAMPAGWTVAGVLAHLAIWDRRIVVLLERWGSDGKGPTPTPTRDQAEADWINDVTKPLCLGLSPRDAARIALAAAEAADRSVAALSDALLAANAALGGPISVWRAQHRREHLDEIERELR